MNEKNEYNVCTADTKLCLSQQPFKQNQIILFRIYLYTSVDQAKVSPSEKLVHP